MAVVGRSQIFGRLPARRGRTSRFLWSAGCFVSTEADDERLVVVGEHGQNSQDEVVGEGPVEHADFGHVGVVARRLDAVAHVVELRSSPVFNQIVETGEDLCCGERRERGEPLSEVRRLSSIHNIKLSYMTDIMLDRCNHGLFLRLALTSLRGEVLKSSCGPELFRGSGHSE